MPASVSLQALRQFIQARSGETFHTLKRKAPFKAELHEGVLVITPRSGISRRVPDSRIDRVCREHALSGSLQPGSHADVSFDASYLLALIQAAACQDSGACPGLPHLLRSPSSGH